MRKYLSFLLCLLIGVNVFAQQVAVKALPAPVKATLERKALGTDVVEGTVNFTATRGTQSVVVNEELEYTEAEAMYTTYDLQSNSLIANRMYQAKDGSVAVVTTMSTQEYDASFADRGTGYNFAKAGDMDSWGDIPEERVEDIRTGWPTIAPYGAEGEILVNHSEGLNYWVRTVAGEGEWDGPHAIPNPDATKIEGIEEGLTLSWARVVTTGENNDVVHIFAAATGSNGYYQFYVRSTDLQEWDVQLSPLAMDDLAIGFYAADDYAVASNGNYVSVVYCAGWTSHVMLYESNDQGLTWTSRMVWECPIHGLDWATDENSLIDQCYGPAHASVAIGKDGVSHVALSVGLYSREELNPNGYLIYYGLSTDGIAYWNDTTAWEYEVNGTDTIAIPSPIRSVRDTELKHALRLWWEDPEQEGYIQMDLTNFCAWMPPHEEEGYNAFDPTYQYTGSEGGTAGDYQSSFGLSAYPSIAVDVYGNLAISWCSPDLNRDMYNGVYYMRTPFVKYKPANVPYWRQVNYHGTSMYQDFIHMGDEATCITAVSGSVNPNEFWFSCLSDDTPGFHTGSITSQPNISVSTVNVFKFTPAEGYEGDEDFDNPTYPEQPDDDDNTATAPSMRLKNIVSSDGLEVYDYIYPSETSTSITCVNEYDFLSNTENIDSLFYDERGNITKIATWTKIDGQWFYACYVDYTYNDKNLRTSRANYNFYDGYGFELGGVYRYNYDEEGRMTDWALEFYDIEEYQKAMIEYDEEGRKISETIQQYNFETYYLENALLTEFEYDERGNCIKEAEFGYELNSGIWVSNSYRLYEYDEFDNCISMENRTGDGTVHEMRIYTYDLSILAENVFYYPNPEEDFPQLPEAKTHLLTSFEYFAQNDEGELTYVNTYIMGYDEMHFNNHWTPDESLYANNMTIITTIEIDGEEQYNPDLELGAFCNGELRGSARLQYIDAPANRYECFLMVYGNSGDDITFRLYDHSTGLESDLKSNEVVDFEVNATVGDVVSPYSINFVSTMLHSRDLTSGWNWYSTYIVNKGAEGLTNLEAAVGTNGIQIKNQTKFVNQASGNWYGTLTSTAVEDMFMIQMSAAHTLNLEGYVVNPAEHPITLGTNWKWISYPLAAEMSVNEAFANANPSNGDYVKSQKGFAQYYEGLGWSGTLKTMTPGMGYMYQNTSGYAKTLVYPMANAKSKAEAQVEEDLHWTADATKYPMNMTVIAVVEGMDADYEVAAFSNGECRGSARPVYIEALGQSMIFMTIYGDDNDNVSFRYYDVTTGEEVMLNDEMTFEVNATHGDVMEPYVMTLSTMGIDETSAGFNIYPNPVHDKLYIETEAEIEEVVVYDVYGRRQVTETPSHQGNLSVDVSNLNSGVYFVQIKTEEGNITKRFVKE